MKHLRDFIYDKNDILIALAILLIAALLITWRMDVIMDYPQTLAKETDTTTTTEESAIDFDDPDQLWISGILSQDITVSIAGGSATKAAECLVSAGLFASYAEYEEVCKAAGRKPEDIKASVFTFERGDTQEDIVKKVTN